MTNGFDKQLRDSLRADAAAGDGTECLDAALVAAWFDGTLSQAERVTVEAHAASCARCQATIAALVRTDRPSSRLWWRAPAVRWLVPAAVAAMTLLVLWTGDLRPDRPAQEVSMARRVDSTLPSEPVARQESRESPPAAAATAADVAGSVPPPATQPAQETTARPRTVSDETADLRRPLPTLPSQRVEPLREAFGAAAPLPQAPESTMAKASPPPPSARAGAVGSPPPAPPPALPEAAPSEDRVRQLRSGNAAETLLLRAGRTGRAVIPSSDPSVQWRIAGVGQVDRSEDGGVTWQTQATGVSIVVSAGAAPSANICWLVGARGVVLKTVDGGRTWSRVAFPEEVDLVGVAANDDRVATVTAAGGRRFHTTDGGATWR